jgi:hypothetical protein
LRVPGLAVTFVKVVPGPGARFSPILGSTFALLGDPRPINGLDGSGSGAGLELGVARRRRSDTTLERSTGRRRSLATSCPIV